MSALTGEWERALHEEFSKEYYKNLFFFIRKQYSETIVYPKADEIFTAFSSDLDYRRCFAGEIEPEFYGSSGKSIFCRLSGS